MDLTIRQESTKINGPASFDVETRSVEVVAATEAPARVYDYQRMQPVDEIIRMDGAVLPDNGRVPLVDGHNRDRTSDVIGSFRDMMTTGGKLVGRIYFAESANAEAGKVRDGHITDVSVGYRVLESEWIPEGENKEIIGKQYTGPLRVTTRWELDHLGLVPRGADKYAKARAATPENTTKETTKMNDKLLSILRAKGLPENATEQDAERFLDSLEIANEREIPDVETERKEATEKERKRVYELSGYCRQFNMPPEFEKKLIADGVESDAGRALILDELARRHVDIAHQPAVIVEDGIDKFKRAAEGGILLRAGLKVEDADKTGASELANYSLAELARECLRISNKRTDGSRLEMVGRALMTTDFPLITAASANKSLFMGFDMAEETWSAWCNTGSVSNFLTHTSVRASEVDDLVQIPEGGPYSYQSRTEASESYSIATYGGMYAITRQLIINDDLNALTNVAMAHGEAAARKLGDLAYAVLTANANMGDGLALFVAGHKNLAAGGNVGAIGVATMNEAERAMMVQTDEKGLRRLNIRPRYVVAPVTAKGAAEVFFRSEYFSDHSTVATDSSFASTRANAWSGDVIQRVYDARLDSTSTTAWYLLGDKRKTVTMYFLNGQMRPYMEMQNGWSVDGVEYKVRIDAGAKAMSWKAMYKNPGA